MSERVVRLKAPAGVSGVQWGGEFFAVRAGHIIVPIGAEMALTRTGNGFTFPDEPEIVHAKPDKIETLHLPMKHGRH